MPSLLIVVLVLLVAAVGVVLADLWLRAGRVARQRDALAGEARALALRTEQTDRATQAERARLEADRRALTADQQALAADREALDADRRQLQQQEQDVRAELGAERERIAGISAAGARAEIIASVEAEGRRVGMLRARRIEADATEAAEATARAVVATAVQRVATPATRESALVAVPLPADDYKGRIIGKEGRNIRAFEQLTGVDVIVDDTSPTVFLSCFDPVRREVARRALEALVADGRVHPQRIEEAYAQALTQVDDVARQAADDALIAVGVSDLHDVLRRHLGTLRFRTSYGQNVLAHLVESAAIARTLAAEIGADVPLVTRAAFLHDIGKALTHEVPGSHAIVGADLARRYGESEAVAHAIEAHHNEVAPRTVEAFLVQASDACSGGRPGARTEAAGAYAERLAAIERIAAAQPGVDKVYAMNAGHELRVLVRPDHVDDHEAAQIARIVAKRIEEEVTYPGEVRVTVVRESRISEVAH
ncbi:MAG TPA: ribonuclease Y [Mycobacteriales bacterium]